MHESTYLHRKTNGTYVISKWARDDSSLLQKVVQFMQKLPCDLNHSLSHCWILGNFTICLLILTPSWKRIRLNSSGTFNKRSDGLWSWGVGTGKRHGAKTIGEGMERRPRCCLFCARTLSRLLTPVWFAVAASDMDAWRRCFSKSLTRCFVDTWVIPAIPHASPPGIDMCPSYFPIQRRIHKILSLFCHL